MSPKVYEYTGLFLYKNKKQKNKNRMPGTVWSPRPHTNPNQ